MSLKLVLCSREEKESDWMYIKRKTIGLNLIEKVYKGYYRYVKFCDFELDIRPCSLRLIEKELISKTGEAYWTEWKIKEATVL